MTHVDTTADAGWLAAQRRARSVRWTFDEPVDALGLCIADMDLPTPSFVMDALANRLGHPYLGYTRLDDELPLAAARWYQSRYGWAADPAAMVFFPFGAKSALHLVVERLTDPGRPVVLFTPGYGGLRKVVLGAGRTVVEVPLRERSPGRYELDLPLVRRTLARTRAATIVLCSPHNPLGLVWPRDSLAAIAALAQAFDVLVISDEVHHWLGYDPATHAPWGSVSLTDRWVVIDSVGKAFNVAGLPHSWAVSATTAVARLLRAALQQRGFYEGSALGDIAVAAALRHGATWLADRATVIQDRMRLACDLLDRAGRIAHSTPTASFLLWLDLRGVMRAPWTSVAEDVLQRTGVRLLDGKRFGAHYGGYGRLNVATTEPILRRAVARLNALSRA